MFVNELRMERFYNAGLYNKLRALMCSLQQRHANVVQQRSSTVLAYETSRLHGHGIWPQDPYV